MIAIAFPMRCSSKKTRSKKLKQPGRNPKQAPHLYCEAGLSINFIRQQPRPMSNDDFSQLQSLDEKIFRTVGFTEKATIYQGI